mgnify:CR=1 FL=1
MSLGARIVIALFAALFGVMMAAVAPPTDKALLFYLSAAFCLAIAIACVTPGRIAQFFGSLVALGVLASGLMYFFSMLADGPLFTASRSDTSLVNSLFFLAVFGIPSALYLWRTRFGFAAPAKPLSELLAVEFDDQEVRVRVIEKLEPAWNQSFKWSEVERVCFKDEGMSGSDILFISLKGRPQPVAVLTEAKGGSEFFGQLTERGLFPEEVWRKAIAATDGGMHCWPAK